MPEPSAVELFLKIDRLEKELIASKQIETAYQEARLAIIQKDKEIASLRGTYDKQLKIVEKHQVIIENLRNELNNQNIVIHNLKVDKNNLTKDTNNYKNSLILANSQIDTLKKTLEQYSKLKDSLTSANAEIKKLKDFLKSTIQPLTSLQEFHIDLLDAINKLLNLINYE